MPSTILTKQPGEERVYFIWQLSSTVKGSQAGTEAEMMAIGLYLLTCLVFFLIHPRTVWLGMTLPIVDWTPPHQLSIKKILHRLMCRLIGRGHYLDWGSFFSDGASLSQLIKTDQFISPLSRLLLTLLWNWIYDIDFMDGYVLAKVQERHLFSPSWILYVVEEITWFELGSSICFRKQINCSRCDSILQLSTAF